MAKMGRVDFEELKKFHAACEKLGKKTDELYIEAFKRRGILRWSICVKTHRVLPEDSAMRGRSARC